VTIIMSFNPSFSRGGRGCKGYTGRIGIKISEASGFSVEAEGWCFGSIVGCYAFFGDCFGVV
jgi:hypothetical protein